MNVQKKKRSSFAFLESNTTGSGFLIIQKALSLEFHVIFLTENLQKYSFIDKLHNVDIHQVNTQDAEAILEVLKRYPNLKGVFSSSDYYLEICAQVAQSLSLPHLSPSKIAMCRDKVKFYITMQEEGLNVPKSYFLKDVTELAIQKWKFPVIVKPSQGTGSVGVKRCDDLLSLTSHCMDLFSQNNHLRLFNLNREIVIQEYIEGEEYSAEIVCIGGKYSLLGITKKYTTTGKYFVEIGHDFPGKISSSDQQQVENQIVDALNLLEIDFGPFHIEFKLQGSKIIILEINPRFAGGMIGELIHLSLDLDIYQLLIELFSGKRPSLVLNPVSFASIRFILPSRPSEIKDHDLTSILNMPGVRFANVDRGSKTRIFHDYRDRMGYVITSDPNDEQCKSYCDEAISALQHHCVFPIEEQVLGRLKNATHPYLSKHLEVQQEDHPFLSELMHTIEIDIAHVLMLEKSQLLDKSHLYKLFPAINLLRCNLSFILPTLDFSRGVYFAYENFITGKVGVEIAGASHLGRSRNDINATLFYLQCRDLYKSLIRRIMLFLQVVLETSKLHYLTPLPIYSQYQVAGPGSYSFYLQSIFFSFSRVMDDLFALNDQLGRCPLGACAGFGTDIPINLEMTAHLLGFTCPFENALDAISNRDLVLKYTSILGNAGVLLSRLAQDFQLWTTLEFQLFIFPDSLCGTSSMMPQKKNPYILEIIKSKGMEVTTSFQGAITKMVRVPNGNSIEISRAATASLAKSTSEILDCLDLSTLVILHSLPSIDNMVASQMKGLSTAYFAANQLVLKEGVSFREAQQKIGGIIQMSLQNHRDPSVEVLNAIKLNQFKEPKQLLDFVLSKTKYGGGPSPELVESQTKNCKEKMDKFRNKIRKIEKRWETSKQTLKNEFIHFALPKSC